MTFAPQTWCFPVVSIVVNGTTSHAIVQLISGRTFLDASSSQPPCWSICLYSAPPPAAAPYCSWLMASEHNHSACHKLCNGFP